MQHIPILLGVSVVVVIGILLFIVRRAPAARRSEQAHKEAQRRDQPVEIGTTYELGIREFTDHHSGEQVGVGKVEGFVLFIEDVPDSIQVGDVVEAKVMSYNRGGTSADAKFVRGK